ncbi:DNA methyltransferase [Singulisphaera sp. Ch08]|uniref:DNA methyltransferase n=1 Tax=Singulisphaera sp. Ch08 TaxID=3120278 RepID=A0AAU7CKZ8_9BACT
MFAYRKEFAFNAICPYYTMFPLEFPMHHLSKHKAQLPTVYDPFCGRGTTIYAARKLGLRSYGLDISPIAAAIAQAKLASAKWENVVALAEKLVARTPKNVPESPFFGQAFSKKTLLQICSLREGLRVEKEVTAESAILRAAALGCLHGPLPTGDGTPSYFSSQMPRTFATKPDYSVRYWRDRDMSPPNVSVVGVLTKKLKRITDLNAESPSHFRNVKCLDARKATSFGRIRGPIVTITSPPYYGMRTYVQDQWLRMWFLGGEDEVDYENQNQLCHSGHERFIKDLAKVWANIGKRAQDEAHLYVRFGSIPSVKSDAKKLLNASLEEAGYWKVVSVRNAQTSHSGKRQADYMGRDSDPAIEFDFHAVLN